jgi:hypothetical protein
MTSNFQIDFSMSNSSTDRPTPPTSANAYCPSVPISVYRELAAELQTAQKMLESLNAQNQQLVKQNQQLRQEVVKVVQSAQQLQQIVASSTLINEVERPEPISSRQPEPHPSIPSPPPRPAASSLGVDFPPPPQRPQPAPSPYAETLVIEQEQPRHRRTSHSEGLSDINGWWLVIAILAIVLTAFGAGFWIVRPLLTNNNR